MVIFGAGASYDSLGDKTPRLAKRAAYDDIRPPQAKELFEMRGPFGPAIVEYSQFRQLIPRLRATTNIEHELEILRSEQEGDPQRYVQLHAIRYYLRRIITVCSQSWANESYGVTNYGHLLERIRHWQVSSREPVAFVTFNYDTLLEDACRDVFGFKAENMESYISNAAYKIFKPHGSINWVRIVDNDLELGPESMEQRLIGLGKSLRLRPGQHVQLSQPVMNGRFTFPAIAIPVETKSESEFEFPDSHLRELRECVAQTTKLLMIGWRGTEQHFLNLWKVSIPSIPPELRRGHIVAGTLNDAEVVRTNVIPAIPQMLNCKKSAYGFSEFVLTDELDKLLA